MAVLLGRDCEFCPGISVSGPYFAPPPGHGRALGGAGDAQKRHVWVAARALLPMPGRGLGASGFVTAGVCGNGRADDRAGVPEADRTFKKVN